MLFKACPTSSVNIQQRIHGHPPIAPPDHGPRIPRSACCTPQTQGPHAPHTDSDPETGLQPSAGPEGCPSAPSQSWLCGESASWEEALVCATCSTITQSGQPLAHGQGILAACLELMQTVITADSMLTCRHHHWQQRVLLGNMRRKVASAEADASILSCVQHLQAPHLRCQSHQGKAAYNAGHHLPLMLTLLDGAESHVRAPDHSSNPVTDLLTVSVSMRTTSMSSCRQLSLRMPPMMVTNLPMGTAACPERARRLLSSCGPVGMGEIRCQKAVWESKGTHPKRDLHRQQGGACHTATKRPPYPSDKVKVLGHQNIQAVDHESNEACCYCCVGAC